MDVRSMIARLDRIDFDADPKTLRECVAILKTAWPWPEDGSHRAALPTTCRRTIEHAENLVVALREIRVRCGDPAEEHEVTA